MSPTPPTREHPYHHGDLRRTILTAALDVISSDGPAALSLRDLARRAGVSHAAPAHHFKDRTGLLTAVATEGYDLLATALDEEQDLRERGVRYVRFALEHPAHFQVMFQPALLRPDDPDLDAARLRAAEALRTGVAALPAPERQRGRERGRERGGDDPGLAGIAAWSLAHGFATLMLSHNLDGHQPEDVFRRLAERVFRP
jgi:AcrR family transcriptional regulator